jgi:hypothetical protein
MVTRSEFLDHIISLGYSTDFGGNGAWAAKKGAYGKRLGKVRYVLQVTQVTREYRKDTAHPYKASWTVRYEDIRIVDGKIIREQ